MPDHSDVFLSYSRNDGGAATNLRGQLQRCELNVFKDDERIRAGELWLNRLQEAVVECGAFVVLVGRDGVQRWIGAETQVALDRYFAPHEDAERLPIFPILLEGTEAETLPAFLRLFQITTWNGADALPERLLDDIRHRTIVTNKATLEGCPFVGLASFRIDQAHLFFGRQKETLDALACFDTRRGAATVRWLEINGNSGSGKSSLMQAGLLPLVDEGWLWPRTEIAHWRRIGPMMPGEHPVEMLAEHLARTFPPAKMGEVVKDLQDGDNALRYWLRDQKRDDTAFLLALDQFEELFAFADSDERRRFDGLLAAALEDADCPLFVISTVRADFLDRFGEYLPRLVNVQNHFGKAWKLAPIGVEGLREVIEGPARLTGLDVSEIKEAMVAEARDEPGALPLVENALHWLWENRTGNRLRGRLFTDQGGLAGILSGSADGVLSGLDKTQRERALELLFRLVQVDMEARRHTRRRIPLAEAIDVAGGGERGRGLVDRLAGQRRPEERMGEGPLRLITVTEEAGKETSSLGPGRWVNLIHETLIRSKGVDAAGNPQPYWPTLWSYLEKNKERAARRERLQLMAREWRDREGWARLRGLAGWTSLFGFRGLVAPGSLEHLYLSWSQRRAVVEIILLVTILGVIGESVYWAATRGLPPEAVTERWAYLLGKDFPIPELVEIRAGAFMMGSDRKPSEQPVHPVTIAKPFCLGGTEVTFAEWDACVADGKCAGYRPADQGWGRDDQPVIHVSWRDAQIYVAWLSQKMGRNCRLPSEAEWEYAARAGTTTKYALPAPDGSDDIQGKNLANCANCGSQWDNKQTAPVGKFRPNAWGLLNMHGNVSEWVQDCLHKDYTDAPKDERAWGEENGGDCSSRILRGGSWFDFQVDARSANRGVGGQDFRTNIVGFRVVCTPPCEE